MDPTRPSELLDDAAARHPDSVAWWWVNRDRRLDYAGARDQVAAAAAGLAAIGVTAGAHVAIVAHNGMDYLVALFAAWWAGATPYLVPIREAVDVTPAVAAANPRVTIYTHDRDADVVAGLPRGAARYCMDGAMPGAGSWPDLLQTASAATDPHDEDVEVACWNWSSYVFDRVRFVDVVAAAAESAAAAGLVPADRCFGPLPIADPHQLTAGVLAPLVRHAAACVYGRWEPAAGWEAMDTAHATVLVANDAVLREVDAESARRGRGPGALRAVLLPAGLAVRSGGRFPPLA